MNAWRILVADDQAAVRKGLRSLLASRSDWEICGEAVDGLDAVEKARSSKPDLVILDMSMPRLGGLEAAPLIKKELPDSQILILSQHDPVHARPLALGAGAQAFVSKMDMGQDLIPALDELAHKTTRPSKINSQEMPALSAVGFEFLAGAGEMGRLIRAFDWGQSPLGPIERWPQALKTSVSLILNSQHPMWVGWGPEKTFLYNDAYISVLSLAKHPWALGRPAPEVWAEIWEVCGPLADKVFAKGEATFLDDVQLFMNRGEFVEETYYSFSYSPIRDESGQVRGLFCPSMEVTPKVLNARRLRTLAELTAKSLVERTTDAACASAFATLAKNAQDIPFALLYLVDREGRFALLEQSCGLSTGSSLLNNQKVDLNDLGAGCLSRSIADVALTGQLRLADGGELGDLPSGSARQRVCEAIILPVVSHGQKQVGVLVAGVNPTRKLDTEYRTFYELISSQIAAGIANARSYEEERKRIESLAELDRAKTAFFSNVSHEFRTPLTLMLAPLEDLLADRGTALPGDTREQIKVIHRNGLRLLKLVNSLLDFSRIEAGRVEAVYQPTDIAALTAELASAFRSAMDRAGVQYEVACDPISDPVYLDRDMWEKIVLNLLSNAFKFTFAGKVSVRLKSSDGHVELKISDTGIGIPQAELPRLFERFHRVEGARGRTQEGTGIGLALVQELVKIQHGTLDVASEEAKGSTFTVTLRTGSSHLPKDRVWASAGVSTVVRANSYVEEAVRWLPQDQQENEGSRLAPDDSKSLENLLPETWGRISAGELIIVADDNADMRDYLRRLLQERYRVHTVNTGEDAVQAARQLKADLILTDVMMPGLDGFGVLRSLRNDPETRWKPVILLSARAGEESRVEGLQAGADDYMVKPFAARELLARVSAHLKMARVRVEAADLERRLRAEAELERGRLRESFSQAPSAMAILTGPDHRFTFVNSAYVTIARRDRPDQLLEKTVHQVFPELEGHGILEMLDEVYQNGKTYVANEAEVRLKRNGIEDLAYMNFSYHPMRNVSGEVEQILVHAVEVTAQVAARSQLETRVKERTAELEEAEERLRALNTRLLRAQDDERRRLARELHDSAGQILAALSMSLIPLEQELSSRENQDLRKLATTSVALVDELSKELRTMSHLLHPPLLDEAGLKSALRWYVEGFAERSNIQVDLQLEDDLPRLSQEAETTIFRIVQEALTNIHRHSGSKSAFLRIEHKSGITRAEIRDQGKGIAQFDYSRNRPKKVGVGIQGMQERVRQLRGKFQINSGDAGTTIVVSLPDSAREKAAKRESGIV